MNNLVLALEITVVGMGLVFAALGSLSRASSLGRTSTTGVASWFSPGAGVSPERQR